MRGEMEEKLVKASCKFEEFWFHALVNVCSGWLVMGLEEKDFREDGKMK